MNKVHCTRLRLVQLLDCYLYNYSLIARKFMRLPTQIVSIMHTYDRKHKNEHNRQKISKKHNEQILEYNRLKPIYSQCSQLQSIQPTSQHIQLHTATQLHWKFYTNLVLPHNFHVTSQLITFASYLQLQLQWLYTTGN